MMAVSATVLTILGVVLAALYVSLYRRVYPGLPAGLRAEMVGREPIAFATPMTWMSMSVLWIDT
jgi:hypothetical protein